MSKPGAPVVIFDFDGTIADSFAEFVQIFAGLSPAVAGTLDAAQLEYLRGLSARQIIAHLKIPLWQIPVLVTRGRMAFSKVIAKVPMFAGMDAVLRELHQSGCQLYVVSSNSTQNIRDFLAANNVQDCFTQVVGGVGIFSKGRAIKKVMRDTARPAREYVLVGDEVRDIEVAKKLGIRSVAVTYGYNNETVLREHRPDFLAASPADIEHWVLQLGTVSIKA